MSWNSKTDYCGLGDGTAIICKSATENRTGSYLEKTGEHGDIIATKPYGDKNGSPSNDYAIAKAKTFSSLKLGTITTVGTNKYMLQSVSVSTGSATEPTMSATAVRVEDGCTETSTFVIPEFNVSPDDIAQFLFNGFTLEGTGCEITQCNAEISCTVGLSTVNGDPVASDPHTGHITLSVTIIQTGDTAPSVTAAEGWDQSAPLTCSDPDSDLPTWTCSFARPLEKTYVAG